MTAQVDIINRALQKLGVSRISSPQDHSANAVEMLAAYDALRRAELKRNIWVFGIRTTALRPLGLASRQVTFGNWAIGTTYAQNDIVVDPTDGQIYFSTAGGNVGNAPNSNPANWTLYFGPQIASEFITTWGSGYTYSLYDHAVGSDGQSYISIVNNNTANDPTTDAGVHWIVDASSTAMATNTAFFAGELVHIGNTVFVSLTNDNGQGTVNTVPQNYIEGLPPPSLTWLSLTTPPTVAAVNFNYPAGAGPWQNFETRNVYILPVGWLREAPQNPKAGQALFLGAPDGSSFNDWNYAGNYFTSNTNEVIPYRFMADIQDCNEFDALFIDGFACRLAAETGASLQSKKKKQELDNDYKKSMSDARQVNGIITGPVYPPEDSYITTRL